MKQAVCTHTEVFRWICKWYGKDQQDLKCRVGADRFWLTAAWLRGVKRRGGLL